MAPDSPTPPRGGLRFGQISELTVIVPLKAGAAGLSLGLVYPPSAYADRKELLALSRTVQQHGKLLAAHIRGYEGDLLESIDEFVDVLRDSGTPGLLSHLQLAGRPNWGQMGKALNKLEQARAQGIDISFDMYPYPAGSSYILQLLPTDALEGGYDGLVTRLSQADFRQRELPLRISARDGRPALLRGALGSAGRALARSGR